MSRFNRRCNGEDSEIEIESDGVVATGRKAEKSTLRSSAELN